MMDKKEIVLIEDNKDHAEIVQFYVEDYSDEFIVKHISDGEEALRYFRRIVEDDTTLYPWLVLLDINLPKYDGHELLEMLKKDERLRMIPVVVFTTSNSAKDIDEAISRNVNSYILKPIDPEMFTTTIAAILEYWKLDVHEESLKVLNYEKRS